jgi:hypothetical protein
MEDNDEKRFSDKVKEAVFKKENPNNVVIGITFPRDVFNRFNQWAVENADNCYWLAIDRLLVNYGEKINFNNEIGLLIDKDDILAVELGRLGEEINGLKNIQATPKEIKTFGKKGELK